VRRLAHAGLAGLAIVVAFSTATVSRASGPATGSAGPAAGGGTSSGPNDDVKRDLDLPVEKPAKKQPVPPLPPVIPEPAPPNAPPGTPPPTNGDDKPPTIYGQEIRSENQTVYYVIDISNSMTWDVGPYTTPDGNAAYGDRLDRAKAELVKSISLLSSNFSFNIDAFDCSIRIWQSSMVLATDANKSAAIAWVQGLTTGGATATGPAVGVALSVPGNKLVVLLTDGAPTCAPGGGVYATADIIAAHRAMIRQSNTQNAVINVFGIAAYAEFRQFCMDVASDNGGSYMDVR
jgi:hypothetical protein